MSEEIGFPGSGVYSTSKPYMILAPSEEMKLEIERQLAEAGKSDEFRVVVADLKPPEK